MYEENHLFSNKCSMNMTMAIDRITDLSGPGRNNQKSNKKTKMKTKTLESFPCEERHFQCSKSTTR